MSGSRRRSRTKLCGITNAADRDAAIDAGAHALGFIVDVPVETPREISPDRAAELIGATPPFVTTVLVTMPESVGRARTLLAEVGADAIQVHDGLAPTAVRALATTETVIAVVDAADPQEVDAYDDAADAILVDSTDAAGGGGTGRTHDWTATRELRDTLDSPLVLAGGLTPDNVAEAVRTVEPFAVDVASGVERTDAPGEKDHEALAAFVEAATHRPEAASR